MTTKIDSITKRWLRGPADDTAVAEGYRFDEERGLYVIWWIERYCKLYEGEHAGEPMILRSCGCKPYKHVEFDQWDAAAKKHYKARAAKHCKCVAAGHAVDWQFECVTRLFGWVVWSTDFERFVRRFRESSIWVAKKNKKSPTMAAIMVYLLMGDNEQGQKVYPAAKDARQVKLNVAQHAIQMVNASEELSSECTVDKQNATIFHEPSNSWMVPLSSGNERHQQAKEGLNGSLFVDEVHVVDQSLIDRCSRMGISRSEPLQAEFSTAGKGQHTYGKKRFDHALAVQAGTIKDTRLLAAVYAAPQDLSDADLAADPLKYARLANPALGHTVFAGELLADYERSKHSLDELAKFKMYRLNIWQLASNPWLRMGVWIAARRDYTLEYFRGRPCYGGLDLSKSNDLTALGLAADGEAEEEVRLWPILWLPEQKAKLHAHLAPYQQWAADGHLRLIPGETIDQRWLIADIVALIEQHELVIVEIGTDPWYAKMVAGALTDDHGVPCVDFAQSYQGLSAPTADFERLLLEGKLVHPGNACLDWQAGHTNVGTDTSGNRKPIKPKNEDHQKIDGIVAAIMALNRYLVGQGGGNSYYDNRGLEMI